LCEQTPNENVDLIADHVSVVNGLKVTSHHQRLSILKTELIKRTLISVTAIKYSFRIVSISTKAKPGFCFVVRGFEKHKQINNKPDSISRRWNPSSKLPYAVLTWLRTFCHPNKAIHFRVTSPQKCRLVNLLISLNSRNKSISYVLAAS